MKRIAQTLIAFTILGSAGYAQAPQQPAGVYYDVEWNEVMMQSTFQIFGTDATGHRISGTVFILGQNPSKDAKQGDAFHGLKTTTNARMLLITAAHVLNGMIGDTAYLKMHFQEEGGDWNVANVPIKIRSGRTPLWTQHPVGDVAVMRITDPKVVEHLPKPVLGTDYLATDVFLTGFQVHPGDEVTCLGFPEEVQSEYGFPILRVGRIASYPIVPSLYVRPQYIDFPVYGGNSGGPAYISISGTRGTRLLDPKNPPMIIGLVIQKRYEKPSDHDAVAATPNNTDPEALADMHLAVYEPAAIIIETIGMLPPA